jgi:hypothetical protein
VSERQNCVDCKHCQLNMGVSTEYMCDAYLISNYISGKDSMRECIRIRNAEQCPKFETRELEDAK